MITASSARALGSFQSKLAARGPSSGVLLFKQLTIIFLFEDWVKRWLIPMEQDWPPALRFPPPIPRQTLTRVRVKAWRRSTAWPACSPSSAVLLLGTLWQRDLTARVPPPPPHNMLRLNTQQPLHKQNVLYAFSVAACDLLSD